jgi:hypothetical protein
MKIKCFECHEVRHFRKNYPKRKDKKNKEKTSNVVNISSEWEIFYDAKSVLVVFIGSLGAWWILNLACTFYIFSNRN